MNVTKKVVINIGAVLGPAVFMAVTLCEVLPLPLSRHTVGPSDTWVVLRNILGSSTCLDLKHNVITSWPSFFQSNQDILLVPSATRLTRYSEHESIFSDSQ